MHLIHVGTNDMVTDILTKPLPAEPFVRHVGSITGMNNYNANCADEFWTVEAGEEYAVMRLRRVFWLVQYRTITLMS